MRESKEVSDKPDENLAAVLTVALHRLGHILCATSKYPTGPHRRTYADSEEGPGVVF